MMDIKSLFHSILPENLQEDQAYLDMIDVFLEVLEEYARESLDISRVFENTRTLNGTTEQHPINKEYIKIYMDDLYNAFNDIPNNQTILNKIDKVNIDAGAIVIDKAKLSDPVSLLNFEHLVTSKEYKQKKGTKVAIEYIYSLVDSIGISAKNEDFNLIEGKPFEFDVVGSLYREVYEQLVKPIAHPLGFAFIYRQIITATLADVYGLDIVYNFRDIEVRCLTGYKYHVYTWDKGGEGTQAQIDRVKADFLKRVNPIHEDGVTLFDEAAFDEQVTVVIDKTPLYVDVEDKDGIGYLGVFFTDGTYLEQYNGIFVSLYYKDPSVIDTDTESETYNPNGIVIDYNGTNNGPEDDFNGGTSGACKIFVQYKTSHKFLYADKIELVEKYFNISKIKENNDGGIGENTYVEELEQYGFNVQGDEMASVHNVGKSDMYTLEEQEADDTNDVVHRTQPIIGESVSGIDASDTLINGVYTPAYTEEQLHFDNLPQEEMFILKGRKFTSTDTSDYYPMTGDTVVTEDFEISIIGSGEYITSQTDYIISDNIGPDEDYITSAS
jgi:hypothetical protein